MKKRDLYKQVRKLEKELALIRQEQIDQNFIILNGKIGTLETQVANRLATLEKNVEELMQEPQAAIGFNHNSTEEQEEDSEDE